MKKYKNISNKTIIFKNGELFVNVKPGGEVDCFHPELEEVVAEEESFVKKIVKKVSKKRE